MLEASNNATAAAQSILDSSDAADRASVQAVTNSAIPTIIRASPGAPTSPCSASPAGADGDRAARPAEPGPRRGSSRPSCASRCRTTRRAVLAVGGAAERRRRHRPGHRGRQRPRGAGGRPIRALHRLQPRRGRADARLHAGDRGVGAARSSPCSARSRSSWCAASSSRSARPPRRAAASRRATSACACPSGARTSSPPSPARSTAWPTACRRASASSPSSRSCSSGSCPTCRTSCARRSRRSGSAGDVLYGQREDFPRPTSRTVELLHTQTDRFEPLLADLLEISRYDAGSVELETEPTNLVHLAGDAIESMHELAASRAASCGSTRRAGTSTPRSTPRRIRRIVRNLIGNAIEHGEGRPIVVVGRQQRDGDRAVGARLRARDDRRGVAARLRPVLARRSRAARARSAARASAWRSRWRTRSPTAARSTSGRSPAGHGVPPHAAATRMPRPSCRRCRSSPTTRARPDPAAHGRDRRGRARLVEGRCTMPRRHRSAPRRLAAAAAALSRPLGVRVHPHERLGATRASPTARPVDRPRRLRDGAAGRRTQSRSSTASSTPPRARATTTRPPASSSPRSSPTSGRPTRASRSTCSPIASCTRVDDT